MRFQKQFLKLPRVESCRIPNDVLLRISEFQNSAGVFPGTAKLNFGSSVLCDLWVIAMLGLCVKFCGVMFVTVLSFYMLK